MPPVGKVCAENVPFIGALELRVWWLVAVVLK